MSFADAARRRDFTINAIGLDPLTGEHADPFGGRADLAARRLRVVDPLALRRRQPARAASGAVRGPLRAPCRHRHTGAVAGIPLDDLPAERIWGELEKLLLRAPRPRPG